MSLWDKDNEHSGQDRRDERPDLSFEMPENIRKLNSDVSWADREEDAGDKVLPPQEPILELSEELGADAGVPAGGGTAAVNPRFLDRAMRVIGNVVP